MYDNKMNICNDVHTPVYKIAYKGAERSDYLPEWLVCEQCQEKRIFGTPEDIVTMEKLSATQLKKLLPHY